jgi:hypothetical protein
MLAQHCKDGIVAPRSGDTRQEALNKHIRETEGVSPTLIQYTKPPSLVQGRGGSMLRWLRLRSDQLRSPRRRLHQKWGLPLGNPRT